MNGTLALVRLALRRDRVILPIWLVCLTLAPIAYLSSIKAAYPDAAARRQYYDINVGSATFAVRNGPLYGSGLGELLAWQCGFIPVAVALISMLVVIRHTRTEEEAGRSELVGATAVGRYAGLTAALIVTCAADLLLALLVASGLTAQGLPVAGSLALGGEFAVAGWVFAAVGAIAAQLRWSAGGARSLGIGALVVAFLVRAVGDSSPSAAWVAWLSPIGWAHRLRPFDGERWWLLALAVVATAVLAAAAAMLSARRDLGGALLPARLGRPAAKASLRSPLALAWRLHRGTLLVWTVCLALVGLIMGGVAKNVGDMVRTNKAVADVFAHLGGGGAVLDAYLSSTMTLFGLAASGYAVQAVLKMRAEEAAGRAEPVLATATGRLSWALGHLVFAVVGPALVLAASGFTTAVAYGSTSGDTGHELGRLIPAALSQLPAVWVLAALAVALTGFLPRFTAAAWGFLGAFLLLGLVGSALQWNTVILGISPFAHLVKLPGNAFSASPLLWLTLVAAAITVAGMTVLRRRDIPA